MHTHIHTQTRAHTLQSMRTRTPTQVRLSVINSQHASGEGTATALPKVSSHGGAEMVVPNQRPVAGVRVLEEGGGGSHAKDQRAMLESNSCVVRQRSKHCS